MDITHGSLFSGIGSFEEASEELGIKNIWCCEIDEWNLKLLKQNYDSKQYKDIKEMFNPEYVDIISGGFPCQDISTAGSGQGIKGSRSGLWSEYGRIIREVRPKYVIIENSPALLIRGFEQVLCDLSKIGYMCEWDVLQANWFGADHRRKRLFAVAYPKRYGLQNILQLIKINFKSKKQWKSSTPKLSLPNEWDDRLFDNFAIRRGDGFPNRSHRIKALGNSIHVNISSSILRSILKNGSFF